MSGATPDSPGSAWIVRKEHSGTIPVSALAVTAKNVLRACTGPTAANNLERVSCALLEAMLLRQLTARVWSVLRATRARSEHSASIAVENFLEDAMRAPLDSTKISSATGMRLAKNAPHVMWDSTASVAAEWKSESVSNVLLEQPSQ